MLLGLRLPVKRVCVLEALHLAERAIQGESFPPSLRRTYARFGSSVRFRRPAVKIPEQRIVDTSGYNVNSRRRELRIAGCYHF